MLPPAPRSVSQQLADRFALPVEKVAALESAIRPHFPDDEMMIELRLVRSLSAVQEGIVTLEQAIAEFGPDNPVT